MRTKKIETIKCPKCEKEYLPCEIFLPDYFLGKTMDIARDENNKIESFIGNSMDTNEEFTCDNCNTTFKISAKVQFFTEALDTNLVEDYTTNLKPAKLFMTEE